MAKKEPRPPRKKEDSLQELHTLIAERSQEEQRSAVEDTTHAPVGRSAEAEAYAARVHAQEEQARREKELREQQQRMATQRLRDTEHRAHAEAQMQLDAFRKQAYTDAYTQQPWPWALLVVLSLGFAGVCVAIGLGTQRYNHSILQGIQQQDEAAWNAQTRTTEQEERLEKDELARLQTQVAGLQTQADTIQQRINDRQKTNQEIADREAEKEKADRLAKEQKAKKEKEKAEKFERCKTADDPLCGI